MRYNEVFAGAVVKEGYRMLALINDGDVWHAIIYREGPRILFIVPIMILPAVIGDTDIIVPHISRLWQRW